MRRVLIPDLLLGADGCQSGVSITLEDGRIVAIGSATDGERLHGRALTPGFLNAHSHAFQRRLRGRVERVAPRDQHDDFWSWRDSMYQLAQSLDSSSIFAISKACYTEMLRAGYTKVIEFHYVHHQSDGTPYTDPNMLAKAVVEAAEAAGIRLLLLPVAYERGGLPRFRDPDVDTLLARVDALRAWVADRPRIEVGIAAHSVRAVHRAWLREIAAYAHAAGIVLHIHADEQRREIEECLAEYGVRPVQLLADVGFLGPRTTVVHATHADATELDLLAANHATVCACPTTEGNLGDGFLPADGVLARGINMTIGSDSHVRVDPLEELREIETNARRLGERRNVLVAPGDSSPAAWLLRSGWQMNGLMVGNDADMIEIDLLHPGLADVAPEDLGAALVFGTGSEVIAGTWIAGERLHF